MYQLTVQIMEMLPSQKSAKQHTAVLVGKDGHSSPRTEYFQSLLEALDLSGHYKGQVEAFYWEQRRVIRKLKAVRPKMTASQARDALMKFNEDLPKSGPKRWQSMLLKILLLNTALVRAAFEDIALNKKERSSR